MIRQKANPYINSLKLEDAKVIGEEREYILCNSVMSYTDKKILLRHYIQEFDTADTANVKYYKVNVIEMTKINK